MNFVRVARASPDSTASSSRSSPSPRNGGEGCPGARPVGSGRDGGIDQGLRPGRRAAHAPDRRSAERQPDRGRLA
eukprot:3296821-Prymnesium_polylepis.1